MIYGDRVKQARELKRFTQKELADAVGVVQPTIAQIEKERISPSFDLINAIAQATEVQTTFFEREPSEPFSLGSLVYRARAAVRASDRVQAFQCVKLKVEHVTLMSNYLTLPQLQLPKSVGDPIQSARLARVAFDVEPTKPIPHVINMMERRGIVVFVLPVTVAKIDAFSSWAMMDQERPFVALSMERPGDRMRFSAAHELGHLLMHKGSEGKIPELEEAANQFAAEFLLPEPAMRQILPEGLTLNFAARLKQNWRVSIQMIIRRARDLGIISDRRYRYLFEQIAKRGWRKKEPVNVPIERPRIFKMMVEMLYGPLEEAKHLAAETGINISFASRLLEKYDTRQITDTEPYLYSQKRGYNN